MLRRGDTFVGKGLEHRFRRRREPPALPVGADRLLQLSERLPSGDRLYRRSQRDGRAQRQFPHESGVEEINRAYGKALSVPIYDVEVDLNDIHPPHKEPVAAKLLDASLGLVYGKKELYSGPRPISATFDGKTVEVVFGNGGKG